MNRGDMRITHRGFPDNLTPDEVDEWLRDQGYNPEEIGRKFETLARTYLGTMAGIMRLQLMAREKRKELKLGVREVGDFIGVSFSTYHRFERGVGNPDIFTLIAVAKWLGVSLDEEFGVKPKGAK